MKVIIAGSRTFNDYKLMEKTCDFFLQNYKPEDIEIVSGCAMGADSMGEKYAYLHKIKVKQMPASWAKNGKSAGYIRNEEMAKYADACIVFWDGTSKGTGHMIDLAKWYNLKLHVCQFTHK